MPSPVSQCVASPAAGRSFSQTLINHGVGHLRRAVLAELQINVGKLCNQACEHCHVEASPKRTEIMTWKTMARIIDWARANNIRRADITGGAPEITPHFRRLVDALQAIGAEVTSRCNLTVLYEPGQEDLAEWCAARRLRLVCSMPCYTRDNVDKQRGKGTFDKSIRALQWLNRIGYGADPALPLDLIYNPGGAFLPPRQAQLEADYTARLADDFGIRFNRLLSLANLPVNRFAHFLDRTGQRIAYQRLLTDHFNPRTVPALMCRHLINVDWTGLVYDCDFNQMLELPLGSTRPRYLWEIEAAALEHQHIAVGPHCFGCTAGAGSSCGGALT